MDRPYLEHDSVAEDTCITPHGSVEDRRTQDSVMDDIPLQEKRDKLPFQIFPDPLEMELHPEGTLECVHQGKERLPSIVVELTDISEVESGELRWPPVREDSEDEDLFLEQCIPPANITDWGEEPEDESLSSNGNQPSRSLLELQLEDFRDNTPTLLPENAPALN